MMNDLETVEDREKGSVAEVTDDSCTVEFIEIVPLDNMSDDCHAPEVIDPFVEVNPEDLQDIKQEPADENDNEDVNYSVKQEPADEYETEAPCFTIQVSCACAHSSTLIVVGRGLPFVYVHQSEKKRS